MISLPPTHPPSGPAGNVEAPQLLTRQHLHDMQNDKRTVVTGVTPMTTMRL